MEVCFRPELGASGRLGNKARRTPLAELRNLDGLNGENVWNYPLIRNLVSNLQWQERLFSLSAIQVFLSLAAPTLGPWVLWPIFNISYRSPKMNRKVSRAVCIIYIYIITYSIQNTYIYTYRLCIYVYMYTTQRAVVPASFVDFTFVSEVQAKKVDDEELGFVGEVTGAPPLGSCWLGKWCVNSAWIAVSNG